VTDEEILEGIPRVFSSCPRPDHFTNYNHCHECREHNEVLRSRDLDTLCIVDVGNIGWDPICFISPEGFAYYLPALARLALAEPAEPHDWYGSQLLFHLDSSALDNERRRICSPDQRRAVVALLNHILETRSELVDDYLAAGNLLDAITFWSAT
jgi:hypothetical protein